MSIFSLQYRQFLNVIAFLLYLMILENATKMIGFISFLKRKDAHPEDDHRHTTIEIFTRL